MCTPAGSSQPPNSIGAWRRRTTAGTTGRRRSVSLITASRYSPSSLGLQPLEHTGVAGDPLERPGERGGRGLVAGHEQGHQLVAELGVGQPVALLVAGGEQEREDVVALGRRAGRPGGRGSPRRAARRPRGGRRRSRAHGLRGPARLWVSASISTRRRLPTMSSRLRSGRPSRSSRSRSSTPKTARMITSSVIACMLGSTAKRRPARPRRHVPLGHLGHHLAVVAHPLAVERRQQQAALAQVLGPVEQEHRALAEDRRQHHVALAGVEQVRVAGEDLLDRLGIGGHHEHAVLVGQQREVVAAALVAGSRKRVGVSMKPAVIMNRERGGRGGRTGGGVRGERKGLGVRLHAQ